MAYNSDPNPLTLSAALAMDGELRQNAVSRYFEQASGQFNALKQFTSVFDPKTQGGGGARSVFCEKTDLAKGGAQRVNFNVIGVPGGPGVQGATELTGNTSTPQMGTYPVVVDWHRDAFELTDDEVEMLAAGQNIEQACVDLLAEKMGLHKQNQMLRRLIDDASGNVYRPNNRASLDDLLPTDTLALDHTTEARAILQTLGAKPLMRNTAKAGCPIDKYMTFATSQAMLGIRNDSSFQTAISRADDRGGNALFSGEILDWQGNPFYEFPTTDQDWDDFKGGPLIAKATQVDAFSTGSATAACKLRSSTTNTKSLYFQWFEGYRYVYNRLEALPDLSGNEYYAWVCNPDGSRAFVAYAGNHDGNAIQLTKILTGNDVAADGAGTGGTSTLGYKTVGNLTTGTTSTTSANIITKGTGETIADTGPNGTWVLTDAIQAGAVIIAANANGTPFSRSFTFGSMSACYAHGRVKMTAIKQDRDYDFVHGRGFKMIFGTGVCKNAFQNPVGYLLMEHAITHPAYPVPGYEA